MKKPNRFLLLGFALSLLGCGRAEIQGGATISASDFAQQAEQASGTVVVDFWATWCGPCRTMKPIFERAEKDYEGRITFVSVDVDANHELAAKYNVSAIPTFILFKDGKVAETRVGGMGEEEFRTWLDAQL